jgi:hypothetical protein
MKKGDYMSEIKKIEQDKEEATGKKRVTLARAEDFSLVYTDSIQVSVNSYDFKLTCTVSQTLLNGDTVITEMATIILTPQHAKDLAESLTKQVADYDKNVMQLGFRKGFESHRKENLKKLLGERSA